LKIQQVDAKAEQHLILQLTNAERKALREKEAIHRARRSGKGLSYEEISHFLANIIEVKSKNKDKPAKSQEVHAVATTCSSCNSHARCTHSSLQMTANPQILAQSFQPISPQAQALLPQMQVLHQMNLPGQMPQNYQAPMAPQYMPGYTTQPPQMPMYNNSTMQQNSGMMQQQQQQKPPYNNYTQQQSKPPYQNFSRQRGNTNTQRGPAQQGDNRTDFLRGLPSEQVFLQPDHPDFQEIAKNFSKTMLGQDIIPSSETTYITHNDGTIVPANNVEVKPYPLKSAIFFRHPRTQRAELTRALIQHFAGRCSTCGLPGHRNADTICPLQSAADSWSLCSKCRRGLHLPGDCLYNAEYLAKNEERPLENYQQT
jgi:hypothetical protein